MGFELDNKGAIGIYYKEKMGNVNLQFLRPLNDSTDRCDRINFASEKNEWGRYIRSLAKV
jgi:hypothetical protein